MTDAFAMLSTVRPVDLAKPLLFAAGCAVAALVLARALRLSRDVAADRWPVVPIQAGLGASAIILLLETPSLGGEAWPGWVFLLACGGIAGLARSWAPVPDALTPIAVMGSPIAASTSGVGASENEPGRRAA